MHVNLKQITFTYDKGVENKTVKVVPVTACGESFYKSEYEKEFFNTYKNNNLQCAQDDSVYLQGTRDSRVAKEEHSYLMYDFVKCHDAIRQAGDLPCKSRSEINEWLKTKSVHLRVLNDKIDFSKFDGSIR